MVPINPFASEAPSMVNALPPDVFELAKLEALQFPLTALAIAAGAVVVALIWRVTK
jgi:hypothetical protein